MSHPTDVPFPHWANSDGAQAIWHGADVVELTSPGPVDYFIDPADRRTVDNAPFLYRTGTDDFCVSAVVRPEFRSTYDAGALFAWLDDTHWIKLAFEFTDMGFPAVVSVVTDEFSDDANGQAIESPSVGLSLSRRGNLWGLHWWSVDDEGETRRMLRYLRLGFGGEEARVGLIVQSPTGSGCTARFSRIVQGPPPQQMRAGV